MIKNSELKKWNLKEAQEDYKCNQIKRNCKNCKFSKKDNRCFKIGIECEVKHKLIEYPILSALICRYFNIKNY